MDDSRFDAWTRRRFGLATGGALATLFGLLDADDADASRKSRRRRKRKRKQKRRERRRDRNQGCQGPLCGTLPDVILIYVDDMRQDDFVALPRTRALLGDVGATYPNYFITTPLCAPSRASFFRGQYAHNTNVRSNNGQNGGWTAYNRIDENTIATWLRGGNPSYRTAHIGKHINGYNAARNAIGPGWSDWIVPVPVAFYDYSLNVNGTTEEYGKKNQDYLTDVLATKARAIITSTPATTPLFLYFSPKAPHGPSTPANRHIGDFANAVLDQNGSFNEEDMSDKPDYMQRDSLTPADIAKLEESNRMRLESLLAVDEAVESLVQTLDAAGRLDNAYLFFATDNGYLLGEHRRSAKNVPYEEAIRMAMLVRGPGIAAGQTIDAMVANIDLAPTIAALAGVTPPGFVDGRSFVDTFDGSGSDRQALLIEIFPPPQQQDPEEENPIEARVLRAQAEPTFARQAIRTADWLYVEHDNTEQERELYDLNTDLVQMESLHADPGSAEEVQRLSAWLATLRDCSAAGCRTAENGPPG